MTESGTDRPFAAPRRIRLELEGLQTWQPRVLDAYLCERLRMPAMMTARHTPTAGVRKRPMEEIAGRGR